MEGVYSLPVPFEKEENCYEMSDSSGLQNKKQDNNEHCYTTLFKAVCCSFLLYSINVQ